MLFVNYVSIKKQRADKQQCLTPGDQHVPTCLSSSPFLPHFTTSFPPLTSPTLQHVWALGKSAGQPPCPSGSHMLAPGGLPSTWKPTPHPTPTLDLPALSHLSSLCPAWCLHGVGTQCIFSTGDSTLPLSKWESVWALETDLVRTAGSRWTAQPGNLLSPSLDFLICKMGIMWLLRRCDELCVTDSVCTQLARSIFSCPRPFIVAFFWEIF